LASPGGHHQKHSLPLVWLRYRRGKQRQSWNAAFIRHGLSSFDECAASEENLRFKHGRVHADFILEPAVFSKLGARTPMKNAKQNWPN
jgi:hypothetical protein